MNDSEKMIKCSIKKCQNFSSNNNNFLLFKNCSGEILSKIKIIFLTYENNEICRREYTVIKCLLKISILQNVVYFMETIFPFD